MAVLVWSERDSELGNTIRSGRRVSLSTEEYRAEAEALDQQLDTVLDMAWHTLIVISQHKNDKPSFNTFEQVWVLGRAINISRILRHEAMQGEERVLLWQALTPKPGMASATTPRAIRVGASLSLAIKDVGKRNQEKTGTTTFSILAIGCASSSCMTQARYSAGNSTTLGSFTFAHRCDPSSYGRQCCTG